jgi:uncharacterized membrane protein
MGTSGLVGQFGAYTTMGESMSLPVFFIQIIIMHFIAPAVITLAFDFVLRKIGWIKTGDMKLYQV